MRVSLIFTSLLGSSLALPSSLASRDGTETTCLATEEANDLVEAYVRLVSAFTTEDATKYLADTFTAKSDSINILAGNPLGSVTFPSKEAFIQAQLALQQVPIVVKEVPIIGCESLAIIWTATFGEANKPVRGINVAKVTKASGTWQFTSFDVEFNSIVWQEDATAAST